MNFKTALVEYYKLSNVDLENTMKYYKRLNIASKDYFLKKGDVSDKIGFVESGLLRTCFINENGDEITTQFHESGTVLVSIESFNNQLPSKESIVAIEPSELLVISYHDMQELYTAVPAWQKICMDVSEIKNMQLIERTKEFQLLSATERYKRFCESHPDVCKFATVGQIASYLGIDIATLSRIRKKT